MNGTRAYCAIVLFVACFTVIPAFAQQPLATFGTHFTFAIPEGADLLPGADPSQLFLFLISSAPGSVKITSPSGYAQVVCYDSTSTSTIPLSHSLMQLGPGGKSNQGLLLETTNPVQVILYDYLYAAGEMTQLYPDTSLGTDYLVGTWGIHNDTLEDNKTEILITAPYDNTSVTITPSVRPIGMPSSAPFTVQLNRGECYVVKADSTGLPVATSLSGSRITASKPVSVITALSCGYVPLGQESCNELLNMPLPSSYVDQDFYAMPFSDFIGYGLLFVSDVPDYFVTDGNGLTYASTNGIVSIPTTLGAQEFTTTAPAQCYELSEGEDVVRSVGSSDPSMVNVLPHSQWLDSLQWHLPDIVDPLFGTHDNNFVSVVYPTSAEKSLMLDGAPATVLGAPAVIPGTGYSNIVVQLPPGDHSITCSSAVFAIASEFGVADAYSYNIGGLLPPIEAISLPHDSITWSLAVDTISTPSVCHDFSVALRLRSNSTDHPETIRCSLTFDPVYLTLLGVDSGSVAKANTTIITTTASTVSVDLSNTASIQGNDTIIIVHFHCGGPSGITPIDLSYSMKETDPKCLQSVYSHRNNIDILTAIRDSEQASFSMRVSSALPGTTTAAPLTLLSPTSQPITAMTVRLRYDHNLLQWVGTNPGALVGNALTTSPITPIDATTDEQQVTFSSGVSTAGELLVFDFNVFVTNTDTTSIQFSSDLSNTRPCPLDIYARDVAASFTSIDTCGTQQIRDLMAGKPPVIEKIVPNPATAQVTVFFDSRLPEALYSVTVVSVLGERMKSVSGSVTSGKVALPPIDLSGLPSGTYFLNIDIGSLKSSASVVIRN